jgi:hypothetical protein
MAQTGYSVLSIYNSSTASAAPTAGNLVAGELAINTLDGVLYYKDSSGVVQSLASKASTSGSFTNLAYTGTLTGGTGVVNLGSGQFYKDASGNIGVGVTPSAFGSGFKGLQMNGGSLMAFNGTNMYYLNNAYFDGTNYKYVNTGNATNYVQSSGQHTWSYAPSDTAGNTVSFAEAMRIDSSGNVGIGTSSPLSKLTISANGTLGSGEQLNITGANTDYRLRLGFDTSTNKASIQALIANVGFQDLLINPSGGNVSIGTTSSFGVRGIQVISNDVGQVSMRHASATAGKYWRIGPDSAGNNFVVANQNGTGQYMSDGGTSWISTSDERLKTDLLPIENATNKISNLRAVTGRFKTDQEETRRAFLIAQDVQEVLPEAITVKDDKQGTLGLSYTDIIPLLVASIKEQQALIESLTTRLTALEAK